MNQRTIDDTVYLLKQNPLTLAGLMGVAVMLLIAVFGPTLAPHDALQSDMANILSPPSSEHWFGTDHIGRDIFSRVLVATRLDLLISVSAVLLSLVVGAALGCVAGYYGGWFDMTTGRLVETIMAFPLFVLAMGIVAAMGNSVSNVVYATALVNMPFYVRLVRAETARRRSESFVSAAILAGNADWQVMWHHVIPNVIPPVMVQVSLNLGWAILNAAGLSFIGLGVRPPAAEWGILVAEGAQYMVAGQWWVSFFPGLALVLAVLSFNFVGDGLRDLTDPTRRT